MFKFLKRGAEYIKLANTFNLIIEELEKINRLDKEAQIKQFQLLGFLAKKGVFDRIDTFEWTLAGKIQVDKIDRHDMIPLAFAIQKMYMLFLSKAEMIGYGSDINDIIEGRHESYSKYQRSFSNDTFQKMTGLAPTSLYSKIIKLIK